MEIKVHNNNVEQALKAFKQKLTKSGFIREMRQRRFYEKPSEKRNRKKKEAKRKQAKTQRFERLR
ncbi:MAG: 30S ribosomal protein S21 [Candidatus Poribacteria bacterium]